MGRFSETLMDHFTSPRNVGVLEEADAVGHAGTLGQGPFMALYLKVNDGHVREARYRTFGCGVSIACGSVLTEMVVGQSLNACRAITPDDVAGALDGVPEDKLHCPLLAVDALRSALAGYGPGGPSPPREGLNQVKG